MIGRQTDSSTNTHDDSEYNGSRLDPPTSTAVPWVPSVSRSISGGGEASFDYDAPHRRLVPPPPSFADSSSASTRSSLYTIFGSSRASLDYGGPHRSLVPPSLTSAGSSSASTRSSMYTILGSGGAPFDYGHVAVANGEDDPSFEFYSTSDKVVQLLGPHSYSSRTAVDAPTSWSQLQSRPRSMSYSVAGGRANSPALSSSSELGIYEDWRSLSAREEVGLASESETDDDAYLDLDDEEDEEEQPTSAMIIAEEGRGVIVRGEGGSVHTIQAPPG